MTPRSSSLTLSKLFLYSTVILALLFSMTGCAKYRPKPFTSAATTNSISDPDISLGVQQLSDHELYHHFSRRMKKRGYKAIQLTIKNSSNHYYLLDAQGIGLQIAPREAIATLLHLNPIKRMVGYLIPAILASAIVFGPIAIIEGSWCNSANKKLSQDFQRRVFDKNGTLLIQPHAECSKVFFVAEEDFNHEFDIQLKERDSHTTVTFIVTV